MKYFFSPPFFLFLIREGTIFKIKREKILGILVFSWNKEIFLRVG